MNMYTLDSIDKQVISYLKENNNASILTLFRMFKDRQEIKIFGSYPVIAHLVILKSRVTKKPYNRKQINRAFRNSKELSKYPKKIKIELLNQVMDLQKTPY